MTIRHPAPLGVLIGAMRRSAYRPSARRATFLGLVGLVLAGSSLSAHGSLATDDFPSNAYTVNGSIVGANGGSGFGAWASTSGQFLALPGNLTTATTGYTIPQDANGYSVSDVYSTARSVSRPVSTAQTGTVWFSFLLDNKAAAANTQLAYSFNLASPSNTYIPGNDYINLAGTTISVGLSGAAATNLTGTYATNAVHLVIGSWTLGSSASALSLWVDPSSVSSVSAMGSPTFTGSSTTLLSSISSIGLYGLGTSGTSGSPSGAAIYIDAIRESDGSGNSSQAFADVTVPEPASLAILLPAAAAVGLIRRRGVARA